ncbi:MAG: PIN domain-containing protein, partial [bacterium]
PEMIGRNARQVSRDLDELRSQGNMIQGIELESGGLLRVALCDRETLKTLPIELEGDRNDNAILAVALELKRGCQCRVVMVSKDTNLRIKADALGLEAQDYETNKVDVSELYTGITEVIVDAEKIDLLFKNGAISIDGELCPNQA